MVRKKEAGCEKGRGQGRGESTERVLSSRERSVTGKGEEEDRAEQKLVENPRRERLGPTWHSPDQSITGALIRGGDQRAGERLSK